jgi:hypothetical protein
MSLCCVCGDAAVPASITCASAHRHVTCDECLRGLVAASLGSDSIRNSRGRVTCPFRGAVGAGRVEVCDSEPWTLDALTPHLDAETAAAVAVAAMTALNVADTEAARMRAELGAGHAAAPGGGTAAPSLPRHERFETYRRDLIESTLTLKCPRCAAAFTDYEGCDSLTCSNPQCGAFFCALCLAAFTSSVAAHAHVSNADHHADGFRGLHGGLERFRAFHAGRQVAALRARIAALQEDEGLKDELFQRLLVDGELQGVAPRAAELAPEAANPGGWLQNLGFVAAELLGPRGQQQSPLVRGIQGLVDLAPLLFGAAGVVSEALFPGAQPRRGAAGGAAPAPRSTLGVPLLAAAASAVLVGGLTWLLRAQQTSPDHPDARALEEVLGRQLTEDELQHSPEELRAMREALLR